MKEPETDSLLVSVKTSPTIADAVYFNWRGAEIHVPSGSGISTLNFQSVAPQLATLHDCYQEDDNAALVEVAVAAGGAYPVPADLFGCRYLVFKGNAAGQIEITRKA